MNYQSTPIETGSSTIGVLIVSGESADHDALKDVLGDSKWRLHDAWDSPAALRQLRRHKSISLLVCDRQMWKQMLANTTQLHNRPLVIVAARDADERLWAEALNMGAYDVLVKPFEAPEVVRSLSLGWLHWRRECERERLLAKPRAAHAL